MQRRPSARLLILDDQGRVLLFRFAFSDGALAGETYWATPGGGLDAGESYEDAAIREMREETGIAIADLASSHRGDRGATPPACRVCGRICCGLGDGAWAPRVRFQPCSIFRARAGLPLTPR